MGQLATKIWIDCDPGLDDFFAIKLAINSVRVNIIGISTVGGNCSVYQATQNAISAIRPFNDKIPIYIGSERSYSGENFRYALDIHGRYGLPVKLNTTNLKIDSSNIDAQRGMKLFFDKSSSPITIVALGPLTNIAKFIKANSESMKNVERIIVMGGAISVPGNITKYAEFNIWNDPKASKIVFSSGIPIYLVGLDVTNYIHASRQDLNKMGKLSCEIMEPWFKQNKPEAVFHFHDSLAVLTVIKPNYFTFETKRITVETSGKSIGQTKLSQTGSLINVATVLSHGLTKKYLINNMLSI